MTNPAHPTMMNNKNIYTYETVKFSELVTVDWEIFTIKKIFASSLGGEN